MRDRSGAWDLESSKGVCGRESLRIEVTWLFSFHQRRDWHGSLKAWGHSWTETTACHRLFLKARACRKLPKRASEDRDSRGGSLPVLGMVDHEWTSLRESGGHYGMYVKISWKTHPRGWPAGARGRRQCEAGDTTTGTGVGVERGKWVTRDQLKSVSPIQEPVQHKGPNMEYPQVPTVK